MDRISFFDGIVSCVEKSANLHWGQRDGDPFIISNQPPCESALSAIENSRKEQEDTGNDETPIVSSDKEEDSDGWEDAISDDEEVFLAAPAFRRVASLPRLASQRSMLTLALNEGPKGSNQTCFLPSRHPSRLPSARGESMATSFQDDGLIIQISRRPYGAVTAPKAIPKSVAHSSRTTKRNMLLTEWTESLRTNVLWARQQSSKTAEAFHKRRRNAPSIAKLHHVFDDPGDYYSRGW